MDKSVSSSHHITATNQHGWGKNVLSPRQMKFLLTAASQSNLTHLKESASYPVLHTWPKIVPRWVSVWLTENRVSGLLLLFRWYLNLWFSNYLVKVFLLTYLEARSTTSAQCWLTSYWLIVEDTNMLHHLRSQTRNDTDHVQVVLYERIDINCVCIYLLN